MCCTVSSESDAVSAAGGDSVLPVLLLLLLLLLCDDLLHASGRVESSSASQRTLSVQCCACEAEATGLCSEIVSSAGHQRQGEQCMAMQYHLTIGIPCMQGRQGMPERLGPAFHA